MTRTSFPPSHPLLKQHQSKAEAAVAPILKYFGDLYRIFNYERRNLDGSRHKISAEFKMGVCGQGQMWGKSVCVAEKDRLLKILMHWLGTAPH